MKTMWTILAMTVMAAAMGQPAVQPAGQPTGDAPRAKSAKPVGAPRVLVMKDLSRRPVSLLGVGPESIAIVGTRGRTTQVPRREVLAVLPDGEVEVAASGEARAWTVDGEIIAGQLAAAGTKPGETVRWQSKRVGELTLKLENLVAIERAPMPESVPPRKPSEDRAILINGDVLAGFIESVGENVTVEVAKQRREAPMDKVARLEFSNKVKPAAGMMVWLASGETLRVTRVAASGAETTLTREGAAVTAPSPEVIGFVENAAILAPLAGLTGTVTPAPGRSWSEEMSVGATGVPLGAADVTLPSPMSVSWAIPGSARRFSTRAVLPPACRVWGDCLVIVEQRGVGGAGGAKAIGGRELARVRLNGETPEADINVELAEGLGPLVISLAEGEGGPIQDRVTLRQPILLVGDASGKK